MLRKRRQPPQHRNRSAAKLVSCSKSSPYSRTLKLLDTLKVCGIPHPRCFLPKSAQPTDNEWLTPFLKLRRVRKSLKTQAVTFALCARTLACSAVRGAGPRWLTSELEVCRADELRGNCEADARRVERTEDASVTRALGALSISDDHASVR